MASGGIVSSACQPPLSSSGASATQVDLHSWVERKYAFAGAYRRIAMVRVCVRLFAPSGLLWFSGCRGGCRAGCGERGFGEAVAGSLGVADTSGAAVAGVALGWWSRAGPCPVGRGRSLPPSRARVYENVDACLLTGARGVADPAAAQAWAGMEDASRATTARMSYLAVTGPATEAQAVPFLGSLLVSGCRVIVASGTAERAAALAEAARFRWNTVRGDGSGGRQPTNVTALAFTTSGLRAAWRWPLSPGVHAAGG